MAYTITVDTGGTFSDLVLADGNTILGLFKGSTTPDDMFEGVLEALSLAATSRDVSVETLLAETDTFIYSTTRSTNAIIVGDVARTAFLTTAGHPDILVYREGGRDNPLNLAIPYPAPYVPRSLTFEIEERILSDGSVRTALSETQCLEVIERLKELEVEAVGVCLLWSIVNPSHEHRLGELLQENLPGVEFTLSSDVNPIAREYRRASATVIDASLKPLMREHLEDIDSRLRDLGFKGAPLMVTHVSGGVMRLHEMTTRPLHSVDSGPALAPIAGQTYLSAIDPALTTSNVLVVDAGGTSFDVSPLRNGEVVYTREKWLGEKWYGHMTGLPAVDTRSIGAGGGSIAHVDKGGLLKVGPGSAGAQPGPACYGRGGDAPTVTDAAVVAGYIDPTYFLGGRMRLDVEAAYRAIEENVATKLGLTVEQAANAILTIANENMRSFITELTVSQGLNPRECTLVAGGGSAGLGIIAIGRELGVHCVVIPKLAAGLSALGGQYSDISSVFTQSVATDTAAFDYDRVNAAFKMMHSRMDEVEASVNEGTGSRREFFAEARYANQVWEIDVPLGDRRTFEGPEDLADLQARFDDMHKAVFAVNQPGSQIEIVAWRGSTKTARPQPTLPLAAAVTQTSEATTRTIFFAGSPVTAAVVRAGALSQGDRVDGPAIIEEETTTIVVPPGTAATDVGVAYVIDTAGPTE